MKTTIEYLQALEEELKYLPQKEIRNVVRVYQEKINNALDSGEKIERILKSLPTPADVAKGIYDSKKVNYLDKRQKEYRRKELWNGVTSLLLGIVVILLVIGVLGYFGFMSFKMLGIIAKFNTQDKIIMGGFVISYFVALIVILIYLLDLSLLLITFLLSKFLCLFPKLKIDYDKFNGFSISGVFEKITKKKSFLGKVLLVVGVITVVFGLTSLVSKGYLYRSFSDTPSLKNEEIITLEEGVKKITIKNTNANVVIKKGTAFQVVKQSEFDRNFQVVENDDEIAIVFDPRQNYDFLGILNEPTILITIELPITVAANIDINLRKGNLTINEVTLDNLNLNIDEGKVTLKDVAISDFVLESTNVELNSNSSRYGNVLLNINQGKFASSCDIYQKAEIKNGSGSVAVKENVFEELKLNNISGTTVFQDSDINRFVYEAVASILTMHKIDTEYFNMLTKSSSQITLQEITADLFTFDLNAGYVNMNKITGDINVVKSYSNMNITSLVGDFTGNLENAKLALYNSIFDNLKVNLQNGNLDLEDVDINGIDITMNNAQAIMIDVYAERIKFDLNRSKLEYHNNDASKIITSIEIKNVGGTYNIDESVKYGEMKVE